MPKTAKVTFYTGLIFLILAIVNAYLATDVYPSLQRAEVLSAISSIGLMLVAFISSDAQPKKSPKRNLNGNQGFIIDKDLSQDIITELAWGSQLLLTATPAATLLIYLDGKIILRRGLLGKGNFDPGSTCFEARKKKKIVSIANTKLYPGSLEFDSLLEDLPVKPLLV